MRRLNGVYHGVDATTDVLTFVLTDDGVVEIIIGYDQARRQAKSAGWSIIREIQLLLAHGLLHGLGYRDQRPKEERSMRLAEAAILRPRRE
jgi:rRNA maturation RNase YbeY